VLATVLVTDIVGSTDTASVQGDRLWLELLERHDAIVRFELHRHRGREVNTTGDGFVAVFDGPARGLRCARAIVEEVRHIGLEVRAGLHTGEIELVGDKIGGIAVHIAARIGSLASPSEVLVSRTVRDLVAGSKLLFRDRGTRTLKGVDEPWQLFALG
jgi:class 3 adenylate cyclase